LGHAEPVAAALADGFLRIVATGEKEDQAA